MKMLETDFWLIIDIISPEEREKLDKQIIQELEITEKRYYTWIEKHSIPKTFRQKIALIVAIFWSKKFTNVKPEDIGIAF